MFDQYGFMYILDAGNSRIQQWLPGNNYGVTVIAATMSTPLGMTFDLSNNIVIADTSYQRIMSYNTFCGKYFVLLVVFEIRYNYYIMCIFYLYS